MTMGSAGRAAIECLRALSRSQPNFSAPDPQSDGAKIEPRAFKTDCGQTNLKTFIHLNQNAEVVNEYFE
jgi:hypothetical protein